MICNNKHCWRCMKVKKQDAEWKKKGYSSFPAGNLGRLYVKVKIMDKPIVASGSGGGSL